MTLHGGRAAVTDRRTDGAPLYDRNLAVHDTGDTLDQSRAKRFIEVFGPSTKIAAGRDLGK